MSAKITVAFHHQCKGRTKQTRYWDGANWFGGFDRARDFKTPEAAALFVKEHSADWEKKSRWLGRCSLPFVTTREEQGEPSPWPDLA